MGLSLSKAAFQGHLLDSCGESEGQREVAGQGFTSAWAVRSLQQQAGHLWIHRSQSWSDWMLCPACIRLTFDTVL